MTKPLVSEVSMKLITDFIVSEEGAAIAEQSLLLGLIMVAVVPAVTAYGNRINLAISKASSKLVT